MFFFCVNFSDLQSPSDFLSICEYHILKRTKASYLKAKMLEKISD